ncbi:mitochondrial pyruvate carrier [Spinellus fusiger]|nr:mitochondrial pyruvate carrier [Spinellus fusiger]
MSASPVVAQTVLQRLMSSPTGPKTIHFWAPLGKWGLVLASLGDLQRPAEKLNIRQNTTLMLTSILWSRWSLVIIPKNFSLFTVNALLVMTNAFQIGRVLV